MGMLEGGVQAAGQASVLNGPRGLWFHSLVRRDGGNTLGGGFCFLSAGTSAASGSRQVPMSVWEQFPHALAPHRLWWVLCQHQS